MLTGAVRWLSAASSQFDPDRPSREAHPSFSSLKAFAEISLFCMLAFQQAKGEEDPAFVALSAFVREVVGRPRFIEGARNPRRFLAYLMICEAAETLGLKDPESRNVLQRLLDNGYAGAKDNAAFRLMDLRYTLDQCGFRHSLPSMKVLYCRTLLAKGAPLTSICGEDAYATTHTIFYLTAYGRKPPAGFSRDEQARWRWLVGNLLGMSVLAENWDLTSELLLCCRFLRWYPRLTYDAAWLALSRAQRPDGSFEGPMWSMAHAATLDERSRRAYDIQLNYHTTLVAALACLFR